MAEQDERNEAKSESVAYKDITYQLRKEWSTGETFTKRTEAKFIIIYDELQVQ